MSNEDDVFLKTFSEMIDLLKTIHLTIDSLKKSVEIIQMSIDGLGTGLTNTNNNLVEMNKKFDTLTTKIEDIAKKDPKAITKTVKDSTPKKTDKPKPKKTKSEKKESDSKAAKSIDGQHPIFTDLTNKIKAAENYKSVGELLIEALEQIESTFSFSRVFYEIRRIGNSLIRKGEKEIATDDKTDILEKLIDWEERLID